MCHRQSYANLPYSTSSQGGYTLIELMIAVVIVGVLSAIGIESYQQQIRKTQVMTIYQTINQFRLPYQTLVNDGAGVRDFSPSGLNMPVQTKYCRFSVIAPNNVTATPNAITCQIQNLSYLSNQTISLDRAINGSWQCKPSAGIPKDYLPPDCQ